MTPSTLAAILANARRAAAREREEADRARDALVRRVGQRGDVASASIVYVNAVVAEARAEAYARAVEDLAAALTAAQG